MPALNRSQVAQIVLLVVLLAHAGLFVVVQRDRGVLETRESALADLERASRAARGQSSPALVQTSLEELETKIAEATLAFPARIAGIALQDHVVQAAGAKLVPLSSVMLQPASTRLLGTLKYPVVTLTVEGQGDPLQLHSFLSLVERTIYATSVLENISMVQVAGSWALKFDLVVYGGPQ